MIKTFRCTDTEALFKNQADHLDDLRVPPGNHLEALHGNRRGQYSKFLKPMGISQYRLAKEIGVPAQRIGEIVAGRRAITADTDLRLCRFFGLSDGYWLRGQIRYETEMAKDALGDVLAGIRPWALSSVRQGEARTTEPDQLSHPSRSGAVKRSA